MTLKEQIARLLEDQSGMSDREIADELIGAQRPQQPVNQACRQLEAKGIIERRKRADGIIGNYLVGRSPAVAPARSSKRHVSSHEEPLTEDGIKSVLEKWLHSNGWRTSIAWGRERGVDIDAILGDRRWVIEVKGSGSRSEMRVNYFLGALGQLLQRMTDRDAKYSVALPDLQQFRNLWKRLPLLAKHRTGFTALFVRADGNIEEAS